MQETQKLTLDYMTFPFEASTKNARHIRSLEPDQDLGNSPLITQAKDSKIRHLPVLVISKTIEHYF
ncbi:hypothetical protein [Acidovorax sp. ACV01]|uniref:hypothetical protein n=1 Tax=Acidovorax sp. ACV01 TaxID=2769311 RepID=UPI00177D6DCB|nr:hypothetical protein [Acidovorax sp. ACV01]MBD9391150.1 hypothetical protein [Acidovorax sp. ACV01]